MADITLGRSRSSSAASSVHFDAYHGPPPKVFFISSATVDGRKETMKDFVDLSSEKVDSMKKANMLIVGGTNLKKTAKLIIAIARGVDVVSERWTVESRRKEVLLDVSLFLPEHENQEEEWGTTLASAIARGKEGQVEQLLQDTTVYTTKNIEKGVIAHDSASIIRALGGSIVKGRLPTQKSRTVNILILGTPEDPQVAQAQRAGHKLFIKDLVILGALRGVIDIGSAEFEVKLRVKEEDPP